MTGTGVRERERFLETLPEFRREVAIYITDKFTEMHRSQDFQNGNDHSDHPVYHFDPSRIQSRIGESLTDVIMLGVWCVVFFMGAYLSFLRYDVK